MPMVVNAGLTLFIFAFPFATQYARDRIKGMSFINPLIAAYVVGILLGNTLLRGDRFTAVLGTIRDVSAVFSIPLMLFTINFRTIGKSAGKALLGIFLAGVSILITIFVEFLLFADKVPDFPGIAGLLVGVYTGGTPNLAAITTAAGIDNSIYLAVNTGDLFVGAFYFLFMITIAKRVMGWFLKAPEPTPAIGESVESLKLNDDLEHQAAASESFPLISRVLKENPVRPLLLVILLCIAIIAASVGIGALFPAAQAMVTILVLTTLSLGASFIRPVRETGGSFEVGEYVILMFALAAGACGDFSKIISTGPYIFLIVAFAILVSLIIHTILSRLTGLDRDTMIITSTAAICSPPFIGVVATSIGNRRIIAPGIAAGLIGYAMGNYLGIAVVQILRSLS